MHLVGILFPHINEDARSKSHQKGNTSTALEQDLMGQKFQDGRDVLNFVPRWLIIHDTEFYQQGIENLVVQKDKCPNRDQDYVEGLRGS